MNLDSVGLKFLIEQEGERRTPYYCSAGHATISIGCRFYPDGKEVKITDPDITEKRSKEIFNHAKGIFEHGINSLLKKDLNQNQYNAIFSLVFNIGLGAFKSSTILRKINENPGDRSIYYEFLRWNKEQKGKTKTGKPIFKENKGLTARRIREAVLYFS